MFSNRSTRAELSLYSSSRRDRRRRLLHQQSHSDSPLGGQSPKSDSVPGSGTLPGKKAPPDRNLRGDKRQRKGVVAVRHLLHSSQALTWIFIGSQRLQGDAETPSTRSFPERFAADLRSRFRRPLDLVINSGAGSGRFSDLLADLHWRTLRFRPDLVLVEAPLDSLSKVDKELVEVLEQWEQLILTLRDHDAVPILFIASSKTTVSQAEQNAIAQLETVCRYYGVSCIRASAARGGTAQNSSKNPNPARQDRIGLHAEWASALSQFLRSDRSRKSRKST